MISETIQQQIETNCASETAHDEVIELLSAVAARNKLTPDPEGLSTAANFVLDYIRQVPYVIKVAWTAANQVGLTVPMQLILDAVISYWERDDDVIPDSIGVIGLIDDAYCSLCSLQMVSDHFRMLTGKHLFPENLGPANQSIRQLLGQPYAGDLDRFVMDTLNAAQIIPALQQLASPEKRMHLESNHTIWSHDSIPQAPKDALSTITGPLENNGRE